MKARHGRRDLADLGHGQIALVIEVIPVKAKVALGVTARGHEKDQQVKAAPA
jgi:hypothetical protein